MDAYVQGACLYWFTTVILRWHTYNYPAYITIPPIWHWHWYKYCSTMFLSTSVLNWMLQKISIKNRILIVITVQFYSTLSACGHHETIVLYILISCDRAPTKYTHAKKDYSEKWERYEMTYSLFHQFKKPPIQHIYLPAGTFTAHNIGTDIVVNHDIDDEYGRTVKTTGGNSSFIF